MAEWRQTAGTKAGGKRGPCLCFLKNGYNGDFLLICTVALTQSPFNEYAWNRSRLRNSIGWQISMVGRQRIMELFKVHGRTIYCWTQEKKKDSVACFTLPVCILSYFNATSKNRKPTSPSKTLNIMYWLSTCPGRTDANLLIANSGAITFNCTMPTVKINSKNEEIIYASECLQIKQIIARKCE